VTVDVPDEAFEALRPMLFSIAYRMLSSVTAAEDLVQDSYLRYRRALADGAVVESPKAYLSAVVTRLAIDELQSARAQRETYVGEWLPEPLLTDEGGLDPQEVAERSDSLSMAFLVLLESLGPVERAVFLLREVFEYGYDEIAGIVNKSEDNCRQIAARARRQIEAKKPRFEASRRKREELAQRFFEAIMGGDTEGLIRMLAEDVVGYGDGGGKGPAVPKPVHGRDKIVRLFGSRRFAIDTVAELRLAEINGQPGAVMYGQDGRPLVVVSLDIADDRVQAVRAVSNPDKLQHLEGLPPNA
jgi:RNA polymerase sigma-70 factor (ECF subfamily)